MVTLWWSSGIWRKFVTAPAWYLHCPDPSLLTLPGVWAFPPAPLASCLKLTPSFPSLPSLSLLLCTFYHLYYCPHFSPLNLLPSQSTVSYHARLHHWHGPGNRYVQALWAPSKVQGCYRRICKCNATHWTMREREWYSHRQLVVAILYHWCTFVWVYVWFIGLTLLPLPSPGPRLLLCEAGSD